MDYCLVTKRKFFVDPHGVADYGGSTKHVDINAKPEEMEWGVEYTYDRYDDEIKEFDMHGDNGCAEDGYNHVVDTIMYKSITQEQYELYTEIIKIYNAI